MSDIGKWCRRDRVDRSWQTGRWHLIESEIQDAVITKCGRRMEKVAHWAHPGIDSKLANHLSISDTSHGNACYQCF